MNTAFALRYSVKSQSWILCLLVKGQYRLLFRQPRLKGDTSGRLTLMLVMLRLTRFGFVS